MSFMVTICTEMPLANLRFFEILYYRPRSPLLAQVLCRALMKLSEKQNTRKAALWQAPPSLKIDQFHNFFLRPVGYDVFNTYWSGVFFLWLWESTEISVHTAKLSIFTLNLSSTFYISWLSLSFKKIPFLLLYLFCTPDVRDRQLYLLQALWRLVRHRCGVSALILKFVIKVH